MKVADWQDYLEQTQANAIARLPLLEPLWRGGQIIVTATSPPLTLDRWGNTYFNPEYWEGLRTSSAAATLRQQLSAQWVRSLGHLLHDHARRARALNADAWRWQLATELALGSESWPDFTFPESVLLPQAGAFGLPPDREVEFYYAELRKRAVRPVLTTQQATFGKYCLWDGGSAVHGQSRPWELVWGQEYQGAQAAWGLAIAGEQVRAALRQRSDAPASWQRGSDARSASQTDWRASLRQALARSLQTTWGERLDYSFQRPSRRPWGTGQFLLPSLRLGERPRLAVVLDTSTSISMPLLEQALAEVLQLQRATGSPLQLIPCAERARAAIPLTGPAALATLNLPTGGGTDLRAGIAAALELRPRPGLVVVLTDGETPWPVARPPLPLVVGLLVASGSAAPRQAVPDWATLVHIKG